MHGRLRKSESLLINMAYLACGLFLLTAMEGCATYSDHMKDARDSLSRGQAEKAIGSIGGLLDEVVEDRGQDPSSNYPLLLVERGTLEMYRGNFNAASEDFMEADPMLEVLDLRNRSGDEIAKFLFSGTVGPYAMPAYEKGMLNTLNMLSFLAQGNLGAARVEARRYQINRTFYSNDDEFGEAGNHLGTFLAGYTFERSGKQNIAKRYYAELRSEDEEMSEGEKALVGDAGLLVLSSGRVPYKAPVRMPIGLAMTVAASHAPPSDQANMLAAQGLVTWVNFTELKETPTWTHSPKVFLDGKRVILEPVVNTSERMTSQFDADTPMMMGAAISRTIARAAAGTAASMVSGQDGWGTLLSLLVQGTMVATDTPDTRSWSMLPGYFWMARLPDRKGNATLTVKATNKNGNRVTIYEVKLPGGANRPLAIPVFLP